MKLSYSRRIPEVFPRWESIRTLWSNPRLRRSIERYLFLYLVLLFIFLFLLASLLFEVYRSTVAIEQSEEQTLVYWEKIITEHPNYPDGYYKAAVSALRLKSSHKAAQYLDQALELDPEFSEAKELRKKIGR